MISRLDTISNVNSSSNHYKTQKSDAKGKNNLFVGGSANDLVSSTADSSVILTGAGDDQVMVQGSNNKIESSAGNDTLQITGDSNKVNVSNGNNKILSKGNSNNIFSSNGNNVINSYGDKNVIGSSNGDNSILVVGNENTVNSGIGNDAILGLGNKNTLNGGDGNNNIVFEGDDTTITAGNGDNYIASLDFAVQNGLYTNFSNYLTDKTTKVTLAKNVLLSSNTTSKQIGQSSNTASSTTIDANKDYIKTTTTTVNTTSQDYTTNNYADQTQTSIAGNKNVKVSTGNGNNTIILNTDGNSTVTTKDGNNRINVVSGLVMAPEYENQTSQTVAGAQHTTTTSSSTSEKTGHDPIIIDFNQDGKVSAQAGEGVDIDGDGKADGAATNGDKMLAMSDINGNGKVDGQEVFGDQTVDPFTGKALNAANGFEALKMVAESAQNATGMKCIDANGLVDLKALKSALQTKGVNLGFVSDNNNSKLEDLTKVAYINTKDYATVNDGKGSVQHNQQGTSIFEDGTNAKTDDVWFTDPENNPFQF